MRKGDPLSPLLFNCVIDWAVASLDNEMGVRVTKDGTRLNHLAFADDVVLVAESKIGIQRLCDQFSLALRRCGITHNTEKSNTLRIAVDGKAKKWFAIPIRSCLWQGESYQRFLFPKVTSTWEFR